MDQNILNDDSFDLFESLDTQPLLGGTPGQSMPSLGGVNGGAFEEMPILTRPALVGGQGAVASGGGAGASGAVLGEGGVDLNLHPSGIVPTLQYVTMEIH